ncbi:Branched-chain amino acid transport protein (AzlD) [Shimia gijangensis]|uniref:Branched-chain amino acid transport protein (AzlD) n=1 Tax=Shimia gijangensis TaxID=1470563 RepID=A0A1M6FDP6_9RHOB|nr:Branched-chain amino acid transport protein (AzlD) [Shimia gijangensis]
MIDRIQLWIVIILMGLGRFGMRFLLTGLVGDRAMPPWVLRHLRYDSRGNPTGACCSVGHVA